MTTLAFDGKILAADTRVTTSSGMVFGNTEKIISLDDGRLLAGCGSISVLHAVASWLNGGEKPKLEDGESFEGILINAGGSGHIAQEITNEMRLYPACIPWASGTGEQFAMTAMRCGKNAAEAVEVAMQLDIYSGGNVQIRVVS